MAFWLPRWRAYRASLEGAMTGQTLDPRQSAGG